MDDRRCRSLCCNAALGERPDYSLGGRSLCVGKVASKARIYRSSPHESEDCGLRRWRIASSGNRHAAGRRSRNSNAGQQCACRRRRARGGREGRRTSSHSQRETHSRFFRHHPRFYRGSLGRDNSATQASVMKNPRWSCSPIVSRRAVELPLRRSVPSTARLTEPSILTQLSSTNSAEVGRLQSGILPGLRDCPRDRTPCSEPTGVQ